MPYRLTAADYSDGTYFHYTYDEVGNRVSQTTETATNTYQYDDANRLVSVDSVAYTWNNNGNLLNDGVNTYTYTNNKLSNITGNNLNITYQYNGLGERVSQMVNGVTTHFTVDLNAGLSQVLSDGTNTYLYGVERIAQVSTSGEEYFLADALGSVRQRVDANGSVQTVKSYEPYGEILSSLGEGVSNFGFTGEWTDDSTELVYLRVRWYSPRQGGFLQRDPWGGDMNKPLSFNPWLYGYGNPINNTDPSGKCPDYDGDGKCDPGFWCERMPNPELRWFCYQKANCNVGLCPPPPTGLSDSTPIYKSYKRLVETPCEMKGQNLTPWWKTAGAREQVYAPIDQTMLVAILVYTEASPLHIIDPISPVNNAWIEMAGNRYAYYCANYGGCGIKNGRELEPGLRLFLSFSPRYADYGYKTGISNLLRKGYKSPMWAYEMAEEIVKPRTWDLNRPFGVFNSQTEAEQKYFYDQYVKYGEKSTHQEGVYYQWGTALNSGGFGDMFILTWYQQRYHRQQHPEFPIGGNLTGG